ncbi:hypothetical protein SAMN05421833_10645 [Microbispora rosea]|uniref:Uncharacterized protein n=1 Tax=Microbispora rosea TaxID=58117 RepID=A0A1N6Y976_9ACTN|nr:hypothetical protein SAMN05421833_10645 [Microbispora rosea]
MNSLDEPAKISPVEREMSGSSSAFTYDFPAHSVTFIRLGRDTRAGTAGTAHASRAQVKPDGSFRAAAGASAPAAVPTGARWRERAGRRLRQELTPVLSLTTSSGSTMRLALPSTPAMRSSRSWNACRPTSPKFCRTVVRGGQK